MYLELCSINQTTTFVTLVPSRILQDRHIIIISFHNFQITKLLQ